MSRLARLSSSFRVRLLAGYMLVTAILVGAWFWSLYVPLTQGVLQQQQQNLVAVAQSGALVLATAEPRDVQSIAEKLVARTDVRLTVVAADGSVIADTEVNPTRMENHADRPEIAAALAGGVGTDRRISRTQDREELYVAVPATLDGDRVALRVAQPLEKVEQAAATARQVGVLVAVAAAFLAVIVAAWASRAAAVPVERLSAAARSMADGDLATRIPEVPGDLEVLADALSDLRRQMRARIEDLQDEQETLRAVLDGLGDAVFLLDDRRIELANNAAGRLFRTPLGGWVDRRIDHVGLPESVVAHVTAHLAEDTPTVTELGPDPTGRYSRVTVISLDKHGERRTLLVVSDITERAQLDRIRRDFVANASHELKTPVAGIQLLADSAETAADDGDVEQALAFARQIAVQSANLNRLVGDLLDLSRLESLPSPDAICDVRQAVDRAVTGHQLAVSRKRLTLDVDLQAIAGQDVFVHADPTDVAIALDNLIDNAINYTEHGGVRVRVDADADDVTITVEDTGIGIPAEDLPRVFERFYRVDRGRSRSQGGTGLGLALVRHVAERSQGSVEVTSEVGLGTTFTLRLKRAR